MNRGSESSGEDKSLRARLFAWHHLAVVGLTIVVALALVFELRARAAQDNTRRAVEAAWKAAEARGKRLTKKEVRECLCGSPSRKRTGNEEVFVWQGALRAYQMRLQYRGGGVVQRVVWE